MRGKPVEVDDTLLYLVKEPACRFRSLPFVVVSTATKGDAMKVMALIYGDEDAGTRFSDEERNESTSAYRAFGEAGRRQGRRRRRAGADATATTVRVRDGADGRHRRPVRRDEGGARRLLPARLDDSRRGGRAGRADPGRSDRRDRAARRARRRRHEVPAAAQQRPREQWDAWRRLSPEEAAGCA